MSFIRELDLPTRQSKRSHHPADLMETSGLSRRKRLSHEEDDYPTPNDASSFVRTNGMALLATFVMAWIWYADVIAPLAKLPVVPSTTNAMSRLDTLGLFFATGSPMHLDRSATSPAVAPTFAPPQQTKVTENLSDSLGLVMAVGSPGLLSLDAKLPTLSPQPEQPEESPAATFSSDRQNFVTVCALVHTLIVCIGIAFGRDTLGHGATAYRTLTACFCLLCACNYAAWELDVGPLPAATVRLFQIHESTFVLIGALEAMGWLSISMLMQHSSFGRSWAASPKLCGLTALAGSLVHAFDASFVGAILCCGVIGSAACAAALGVVVSLTGASALKGVAAPAAAAAMRRVPSLHNF